MAESTSNGLLARILARGWGIYILLALTIALFGLIAPAMVGPHHLLELSVHAAALGIVAMGQTLVMLLGMFDLSVGAIMTLVNVIGAGVMGEGQASPLLVLPLLLCLGAFIGWINGLGITRLKLPPFMMTLAMWLILRGAVLVYTKGGPKGVWPPSVQYFAKGWLGGIFPVSTLFWIILTVAGILLLRHTVWGRYLYAVGGNPKASFLSGLKTNRVVVLTFTFCGMMAALAGIILSGFVGWGSFQVGGEEYLLNSVAASVLGGTTFSGGIGGLSGTLGGAYLLTLIDSGLTMAGVGYAGRLVFTGAVIVVFTGLYERLAIKTA